MLDKKHQKEGPPVTPLTRHPIQGFAEEPSPRISALPRQTLGVPPPYEAPAGESLKNPTLKAPGPFPRGSGTWEVLALSVQMGIPKQSVF